MERYRFWLGHVSDGYEQIRQEEKDDYSIGDEMLATLAVEATIFQAIEILERIGEDELAKTINQMLYRCIKDTEGNIFVELELE